MPNTVITLKKSATPSASPADLANGELAINFADGKLFYKNTAGFITEFSSGGVGGNFFGTVNANSTLIVADTSGDVLTIEAGSGIAIVGDAVNDKLTISATGTSSGASVNVGNTLPPAGNTSGSLWWNTDLGRLLIYYTDVDGSQWVDASPSGVGPEGPRGPAAPKTATIEFPQANDVIPLFYNYDSFTLTEIRSVLLGSAGANVTFSVRYADSIAVTGTEVVTGGIICTNTTNGLVTTTFTNATIPASNFIWVTISAATNTTNTLHFTMR